MGLSAVWVAVTCSLAARCDARSSQRLFGLASVGGNMPINSGASPSDAGLRGGIALGFVPLPSTPEIELTVRAGYDRFFSNSPARWVRSLQSLGGELLFYPEPDQPRRVYLLLGAGVGHADQGFTTVNDPYGTLGIGTELGTQSGVRYLFEVRLTDLSNSTYGDFRFLTVSLSLRI